MTSRQTLETKKLTTEDDLSPKFISCPILFNKRTCIVTVQSKNSVQIKGYTLYNKGQNKVNSTIQKVPLDITKGQTLLRIPGLVSLRTRTWTCRVSAAAEWEHIIWRAGGDAIPDVDISKAEEKRSN